MSEEAHVEESVASDAQPEVEGGSPHFAVGDSPPGAETVETEPAATDKVSDGAAEEQEVVAEAPPSEPFWSFKTADGKEKVFSSSDEAQQFFSSWNGRLSKAERELQEVTRLNLEWQNAYNNGELPGMTQADVDQKKLENAATVASESGALQPYEWKTVNEMIQNGEGEKALQYIQYRNQEYLEQKVGSIEKKFEERIEQLVAPAKFQHEVSEAMTYVAMAGQAAVNDMGEPLYPEFQDGASYDSNFVKHFREIWLDMDYRMAANPDGSGFDAAYYKAKATYSPPQPKEPAQGTAADFIAPAGPAGAPARAVAAANIPRNPDGTFARRNQALSMSGSEGAGAGSPRGTAANKSDSILDAMRDVGTSKSPHFAVAPD